MRNDRPTELGELMNAARRMDGGIAALSFPRMVIGVSFTYAPDQTGGCGISIKLRLNPRESIAWKMPASFYRDTIST